MIRKIMQTAAVFLLTGVLAVTAVTTYVTVPDEPAADEETQAEEAGTIESVTAPSLAGRQDVYFVVDNGGAVQVLLDAAAVVARVQGVADRRPDP